MEMGVVDGRRKKRGVLYGAVLKFGEIKTGAVKGGLPDPAHSEGTAGEMGKLKIRVVGDTVERHAVKIGLAEKTRRKARLGRAVINALIDDLQRALRVKGGRAVLVLLAAALGVGLGQKLLLCQKRLYLPADFLHPLSVVLAACIPQAN